MELDLRDYIRILRKRLWIILILIVLACSSTAVISYAFIEPVYEASTKLIVNNREDVAKQLDLNSVNLDLRLIDTYKEIIKTNAIMDKVAADHPNFSLTPEQLMNKISVSSVNNTQVLTLSIRDESYEKAAQIVNEVAAVFVNEIPKIMTVNNVSILSKAKLVNNPSPVQPNPQLNIAISFVVALMIGVGLVFLLEYFDDTIKTEQDVRLFLDLPTLALIPKVKESDIESMLSRVELQAGDSKNVKIS